MKEAGVLQSGNGKVRQLACRLGKAEDARAYNELITSWTPIKLAAANAPKPAKGELFE